ncbi:MAG: hypothetical protein M1817_006906 [Caeruleum heppii]|nr:MAG: hypothetical protein M1817_006906 [Caeruleum heppii]
MSNPTELPADEEAKTAALAVTETNSLETPPNGTMFQDQLKPESVLSSKKAFLSWLLLCYSTGPTFSMKTTYIPAAIQSMTNLLGHEPGSLKACARRGAVRCVIKFGANEVDYNSYVLYLLAIARAIEGIVTILLSGVADYSHYRKVFMITTIVLFGALATPYAGLTDRSFPHLTVSAVLFCAMSSIQGVYGTLVASYIPLFMRASGWYTPRVRLQDARDGQEEFEGAQARKRFLAKGARVSVLGLVVSNIGAITALLIGVIIAYTKGTAVQNGYHNFLLAVTIAGCITIVLGLAGGFVIPSVKGKTRPPGLLITLSARRFYTLLRSIRSYPEAFKFCLGWVLWNTAWANFNSVIGLLFRETLGIGASDPEFTVWTFTGIIFAVLGSLSWLFIFPRATFAIKTWAYGFIGIQAACMLWGTIGISPNVTIGYKHRPEFWIEQFLFFSTASALRCLNRVVYSSMLPRGREAQFFGLEITLDLATGWVGPLVQGAIQQRTGNLRWPMLPNLFLIAIAAALYVWTDVEKGMSDAEVASKEGDKEAVGGA